MRLPDDTAPEAGSAQTGTSNTDAVESEGGTKAGADIAVLEGVAKDPTGTDPLLPVGVVAGTPPVVSPPAIVAAATAPSAAAQTGGGTADGGTTGPAAVEGAQGRVTAGRGGISSPLGPSASPTRSAPNAAGTDANEGDPATEAGSTAPTFAAEVAPRPDPGPGAASPAAVFHAKVADAAHPAGAAPVPLGAVPMTIGLRSLAGSNQFEIRLDPKDLGRIDVSLDIDRESGTVQAHLVVDRPETLALLQRDAGTLQQALAQAGLEAGDGSIALSLRGDGSAGGNAGGSGAERQASGPRAGSGAEAPEPSPLAAVPLRRLGAALGIDIRI